MWQVLRFLYFHQSVYIYISLFPPPLVFHSRTSYFCAHVLRRDAFFQIVSSIASTIAHGSRRARSVNFNSRDNIVSTMLTRSTVDRNPPGDLWTYILSISLVFVCLDCVLVLFNPRSVHTRGREGGGGPLWILWTIRR